MDGPYLIKLTVVLYKVTELFPKREPLKFSLRKKANDILADFILVFGSNPVVLAKPERKGLLEGILKNIQIIQTFFELAKSQFFVRQENFLVLKREYEKLRKQAQQAIIAEREAPRQEQARKEAPVKKEVSAPVSSALQNLKQRQKRILQVLQKKDTAQVQDFLELFPDVTKRTLRRDFEFLFKQGIIERIGKHGETTYRVK